MTDKQLEEYTRLKIQEAREEFKDEITVLKKTLGELEESKNIKPYRTVNMAHGMFGSVEVLGISYSDADDLTKELNNLQQKSLGFEYAITKFRVDSLLGRLKKALKGEL